MSHEIADRRKAQMRIVTVNNPDAPPLWTSPARVEGKPEHVTLAGGWVAVVNPGRVEATPGQELVFSIELRPTLPGSGQPNLLTKGPRVQLQRGEGDLSAEGRLPEPGGIAYATLIVGPNEWGSLDTLAVAFEQRERPNSVRYLDLPTPAVRWKTPNVQAIAMETHKDGADIPRGLSVVAGRGEATVTFTTGSFPYPTAISFATAYLIHDEVRSAFIVFIREEVGDVVVCWAPPQDGSCLQGGKSAVRGRFSLDTGPVDVVVFSAEGHRVVREVTAVTPTFSQP